MTLQEAVAHQDVEVDDRVPASANVYESSEHTSSPAMPPAPASTPAAGHEQLAASLPLLPTLVTLVCDFRIPNTEKRDDAYSYKQVTLSKRRCLKYVWRIM